MHASEIQRRRRRRTEYPFLFVWTLCKDIQNRATSKKQQHGNLGLWCGSYDINSEKKKRETLRKRKNKRKKKKKKKQRDTFCCSVRRKSLIQALFFCKKNLFQLLLFHPGCCQNEDQKIQARSFSAHLFSTLSFHLAS